MDKPVTMTKNRLAIRRAFLDGKINAVCGYPGIGKTYLTMIHPTFIDGFFSKQYYTDKKKGIVNPDFPENYARFCAEAMERGQIVVCAMHPKAREVFDSQDCLLPVVSARCRSLSDVLLLWCGSFLRRDRDAAGCRYAHIGRWSLSNAG